MGTEVLESVRLLKKMVTPDVWKMILAIDEHITKEAVIAENAAYKKGFADGYLLRIDHRIDHREEI